MSFLKKCLRSALCCIFGELNVAQTSSLRASYREKRSAIRCFTVALIKPMCQCCPRVSLSDGLLAFSRICWETQEALFEETRTKRIKIEVCKHQHNEEFSLKNLAEKSHKVPFSSHPSTNPSHFLLNPENAARNVTCATKKCRGLAWRGHERI